MDGEIVFCADFEVLVRGRQVEAALREEVEDLDDGAVGAVLDRDDCEGESRALDGGKDGPEGGERV